VQDKTGRFGRPTTDTASQYITADKPEVTASFTNQEVTTSTSTPAHASSLVYPLTLICMSTD